MSERSGIPVSTLSKVENDRLTLTYDKILQLSEKLEIRISELFAETEPAEARHGPPEHRPARRRDPGDDAELRLLLSVHRASAEAHGAGPNAGSAPSRWTSSATSSRHSGEEYIHVLEGTIVVHTQFYDPVTLKAGEAIYIDSKMGHAYVAAEDCDEALVLGVCSSDDDALVSSLMHMHEPVALIDVAVDKANPKVRVAAAPSIVI